MYIKMAADCGNTDAMKKFANILEKGDGIPVDIKEAKKYYKMAEEEEEEWK